MLSGRRHDAVAGHVVARAECYRLRVIETAYGLSSAENRQADGVIGPQRVREHLVDLIVGRVFHPRDLFDDDLTLTFAGIVFQKRLGDHVREDLDGQRNVLVHQTCVVAGVFLAREGVEFGAEAIERLGDLRSISRWCALEHHVFHEVRHTCFGGALVAAAHCEPDAQSDRAYRIHRLRQDGHSVLKDRFAIEHVSPRVDECAANAGRSPYCTRYAKRKAAAR